MSSHASHLADQKGVNLGGLFKHKSDPNRLYYVKKVQSADHAKNEVCASSSSSAWIAISTLLSQMHPHGNSTCTSSPYIPSMTSLPMLIRGIKIVLFQVLGMAFYRLLGLQVPKLTLISINGVIRGKTGNKTTCRDDVVRIRSINK